MARLGEFGAARKEAEPTDERDTFMLCGVEFTAAEEVDTIAIMEFAEVAASGEVGETPAGMAAMLALIRSSVDEAEWPKFRATVRRHRPTPEVLMELAMAVVQRETGRPTERPSDSSDGPSTTGESSRAPSSSAASSAPILSDPRILELVPVDEAGQRILAAG